MASKNKAQASVSNPHGVKCDPNVIQRIPLRDIEVDWTWNARTASRGEDGKIVGLNTGKDEGKTTYSTLKESIHRHAVRESEKTGEYDPINNEEAVTLKPNRAGAKKPYFLVAGFLRYEAISQLAEENDVKHPHIRAIVESMSDRDAILRNMSENTGKTDFSQSDLAGGIAHLMTLDPDITQTELAAALNKDQTWIGRVIAIVRGIKDPVLIQRWREGAAGIPTIDMLKVAKLDSTEEQKAAFDKLARDKAAATADVNGHATRGRHGWVASAMKQANEAGWKLGMCVRANVMTLKEEWKGNDNRSVTFFDQYLLTFVPSMKAAPTVSKGEDEVKAATLYAGQRKEVELAFRQGFQNGKAGRPMVAAEEGASEEKAEGKGKKGKASAEATN